MWVGKGGIIDPEIERGLRGLGPDGGDDGDGGEKALGRGENEQAAAEEPSWKQRRKQRLLAAGIMVERDEYLGRAAGGNRGGERWQEEDEELDNVGDFTARVFPVDPQEVGGIPVVEERVL